MITLFKTNSTNLDFIKLVARLDADLTKADGEELQDFYAQFNNIQDYKYVLIAYNNKNPVGCGAIKPFSSEAMEIKRMYVENGYRGKGIASKILAELESWAKDLSYKKCVLETGTKQQDALRLYTRKGYVRITNYGQYAGFENSLCFEKIL